MRKPQIEQLGACCYRPSIAFEIDLTANPNTPQPIGINVSVGIVSSE
jgi:hypothetical protein